MNYLKLPTDSNDFGHLKQAIEAIGAIRPYVRYFDSYQYVDDLANGEICLAPGWSGGVYQGIQRANGAVSLSYVVPKEGTLIWVDTLAIPADAPHPEHAHLLLDCLMRPQVAARNSNATYFANANLPATSLVDPSIRDDPGIHPPPQMMGRIEDLTVRGIAHRRAANVDVVPSHPVIFSNANLAICR